MQQSENKHELEKANLMNEQLKKEVEYLKKEANYLKEIINNLLQKSE
jgi:hypothetical protein